MTINHIYILIGFALSTKNRIFYIKTIIKSNNTPPLSYSFLVSDINKSNLFILFDQCFLLHLLSQISMTCKKHLQTTITLSEVYQVFMFLGPNKKTFSPRIRQTCNYVLCEPLYHLFMMSLEYAIIPEA